ncbi:MAG: excinuclease ABC subunit UvrA [Opitutaceae bacterium]|nr:excinuclease ABC subunit UvrA [Opitutaceae bacterium]
MVRNTLPSTASRRPVPAPESIRLRGVRQNNLKGFDLDLPLGRYIVVTGLSGAGKSSLVFETLHAEGQRRYVETFSAYTRQFLDLLAKPRVDSIENIRPSIAIEQTNTVKTSRSTVGTMTELCDFFKVWFAHVAELIDPATGQPVHDDTPATIWEKALAAFPGRTVLPAFEVARPANMSWPEILASIAGQGYTRIAAGDSGVERLDALDAGRIPDGAALRVIQDRVVLAPGGRTRFLEAAETALHFGRGQLALLDERGAVLRRYSRGLRSPETGQVFRPATPALFSFNSPLGACPKCRGFGRVIEIDYRLAIPDTTLSIEQGAIKAFEGQVYSESKADLIRASRRMGVRTKVPYSELTERERELIMLGEPRYREQKARGEPYDYDSGLWYGLKGFFDWLEGNTYKMHVRVFLSRFRAYVPCPACGGARLQPEGLHWHWQGRTLPELYRLPVSDLVRLLDDRVGAGRPPESTTDDRETRTAPDPARLALDSILTRLRYLEHVGLGYLTLDRASRTLSGGEVERVNLTSCLGTSLVDTLFVLDEPSVGLHPRDIDRLIAIIRSLTDSGNTVVVVEHDEAMIRAADHVIEVGPEPGARGGQIVFQGTVAGMLRATSSITGAYFSGRETFPTPASRRPCVTARGALRPPPVLRIRGAAKHNLRGVDLDVPLQRFVCLSGVSGSGKSTLLDAVIHQGLLTARGLVAEDPAAIESIASDLAFSEIVLVDQSPVSRTPRSNPALYTEAWDEIRELFAATPEAEGQGYTASSFSFNAGDGRCEHCQGLGYEKVEMQFLSDVYIPCPVCEGRRFKDEILAVRWRGLSIGDTLALSVAEAQEHFREHPRIARRLAALSEVGLDYLTLGQPLNTLSGGESQRLKLVKYLGTLGGDAASEPPAGIAHSTAETAPGALLLLDEPTTGLHRHDVKKLVAVLQALVDRGHSLIVIEHNTDVLKSADWIIEVGPEAGAGGGRIVAVGTPEQIAGTSTATAPFLRAALAGGSAVPALLAAETPGTYGADARAAVRPSEVRPVLSITGARENNLQNLSVCIPHRELSVVTGVSGSGKSTLAFDIVFAEGQRRFMESMSPYARQFVEQLPRPHIDRLTGIPPTVAIEQRVTRGSRKSTVATITEVAQYLRLLYARVGVQHNPATGQPVLPQTEEELLDGLTRLLATRPARTAKQILLLAPIVRGRKGHHQPLATWATDHGYERLRVDGRLVLTERFQKLDRYKEHDIEVVVADLRAARRERHEVRTRLAEALRLGRGSCFVLFESGSTPAKIQRRDSARPALHWFSTTRTDAATGESFPELDPKHFSFNSPKGWCPACRGHGHIYPWMLDKRDDDEPLPPELADLAHSLDPDDLENLATQPCPECGGERLNRISRAVKLPLKGGHWLALPELTRSTPDALLRHLRHLALDKRGRLIAADIIPQVEERLKFMAHVGLGYLSLDRATETLSGGEAQRIRLAAQLGTNLAGVLYVLDEPSIGLHARDNDRLIATLLELRDKGNTLLVVEHDDALMERADRIIDLGPGAGIHGGRLLANGTLAELKANPDSLTGRFLARHIAHPLLGRRRDLPAASASKAWMHLTGVSFRNLSDVDLHLPLGRLIMVSGVSGAGKSTLVRDILHPAVTCAIKHGKAKLTGREFQRLDDGSHISDSKSEIPFAELRGAHGFRTVIEVDQSPIGKTPRSTPATYLGAFDLIRQFFANLPEAKMRGYNAGRFSFNTAGGRCETCAGAGRVKLEMSFMPDTYLPCDACGGTRYGPELADITWKGKTIADVLALSFEEAATFFDFHAQLRETMQLMVETGLGYLTLGQSSPTLSGGEAQRLKLVTELTHGLQSYAERKRGEQPRNLYLLEEPTIGLHLSDCEKLIRLLHRLVDQGHTVVVIEHHLDLLAEADYLVEVGPGGGPEGGRIVYQGALDGILRARKSPTGPYLRSRLGA